MNKVILMGRLTADPQVSYSTKNSDMAIARYTLAVDRRMSKKEEGKDNTDFIRCVAFGKSAEWCEKYFHIGQRVLVEGRLRVTRYEDKEDGKTKYSTDVIIDTQEFADSKQTGNSNKSQDDSVMDGFMNIPEGIDDEELPFN